jgi:hypothetical protein
MTDVAEAGSSYHIVRLWGLTALATRWPDRPSTRSLIHGVWDDECGGVRFIGLAALAASDCDALPLLRRACGDADGFVRWYARQALVAAGFDDTVIREVLFDAARDGDSDHDRDWSVQALALRWPDDPEVLAVPAKPCTTTTSPTRPADAFSGSTRPATRHRSMIGRNLD